MVNTVILGDILVPTQGISLTVPMV